MESFARIVFLIIFLAAFVVISAICLWVMCRDLENKEQENKELKQKIEELEKRIRDGSLF